MSTTLPESCRNCGAPRTSGLAECRFCKTPMVENTMEEAVPCPQCGAICEWGSQQCVLCHAWVVVKCVFCDQLSPHQLSACLSCGEPFAGAVERFEHRKHAAQLEQGLHIASTVGGVAASFLGAMAGSAIMSEHHHERSFFEELVDSGNDNDDE
jgi:hypothetical protein